MAAATSSSQWAKLEEDAFTPMRRRRSFLLAAAFGILLTLVAVSAVALWQKNLQIQENISQLHRTHYEAAAALTDIKSGVYVAGILFRDSLLDPDPSNTPEYVSQFETIQKDTERNLGKLEAFGHDSEQQRALELLRSELKLYWAPAEVALDLTPEERVARRMQLLRQRVRKRQEIFEITGRIETLLASNFTREQRRVARTQEELKTFLGWSTAVVMVLGFAIAAFTIIRLRRLERRSEEASSELRRLSKSLRTAQEEERKSLSRELHDEVGQMLTGLRMELGMIQTATAPLPQDVVSQLNRARGTLEQTLKQVRNRAMLLRPSMLDDLGLGPALSWQAKEFSRLTGITTKVDIDDGLDELPDQHRTCLYRVVQEALTNCARHSRAANVSVVVSRKDDSVTASVTDDGVGFAIDNHGRRGLGLLGMEERVRELHGHFDVTSKPGSGTRITVTIPAGPQSEDEHTHRTGRRPWHRTRGAEASA
jgi:signal transduction histidine kinase